MPKAVRIVLIVLGVLLLVLVGAYFAMPSHLSSSVTQTLSAPPEALFSHAGNLRTWQEWTSWAQKDPSTTYAFGETTSGVGGTMRWAGKEGKGSLTFTEVVPNEKLVYSMTFEDFKPTTGSMVFIPKDGKTEVTWTMEADMEGVFRLMALVFDSAIKDDFQKGLAGLETYAADNPIPDKTSLEADSTASGN